MCYNFYVKRIHQNINDKKNDIIYRNMISCFLLPIKFYLYNPTMHSRSQV